MSTEDPFITGMRTNLNKYNAEAEQRLLIKARKARRSRITTRVIIGTIMVTLGLATGTALANITDADAATQQQINRFIKSEGGIPPCKHEDSVLKVNGKKVTCVWWAGQRGNGKGDSFLRTANDHLIYITGPKAARY